MAVGQEYAWAVAAVIEQFNREVCQRADPAMLAAADAVLRAKPPCSTTARASAPIGCRGLATDRAWSSLRAARGSRWLQAGLACAFR